MKQIWYIYTNDIRNIAKHWAAIIIVLGLMILPSLYAWFNIGASWNPYANTKDVPIAVANQDAGANLRGKDIDIGKEIVKSLKKNKNLGWKFVDEQQAIEGVKHGKYYASITIPKDFSEKITTVLSDNPTKPELDYYVNEKINAIAPKITAKGAAGVTEEVSKNFVKTANGEMFKLFNKLGIDLEANLPTIEKVKELIFRLEGQFPEIHRVIDTALDDAGKAQGLVKTAQDSLPAVEDLISGGQQMTKDLDAFFARNQDVLEKAPAVVKSDLMKLQEAANGVVQITDFLQNPADNIDLNKLSEEDFRNIADVLKHKLETVRFIASGVGAPVNGDLAAAQLKEVLQEKKKFADLSREAADSLLRFSSQLNDRYQTHIFDSSIERLQTAQKNFTALDSKIDEALAVIDKGGKVPKEQLDAINQSSKEAAVALNQVLSSYEGNLAKLEQFKQSGINLDQEKGQLHTIIDRSNAAIQLIDSMIPVLNDINQLTGGNEADPAVRQLLQARGDFQKANDLAYAALDAINKGKKPAKDIIDGMNAISKEASKALGDILARYDSEIVPRFNNAIARTKQMSKDVFRILSSANESLPTIKKLLDDAAKGLVLGIGEVKKVKADLPGVEAKIKDLAAKIRDFESKENIRDVIKLLKNDVEKEKDFFANPVKLKENRLFPVSNYGSAMSPFYTVLSLWVGALLLVSLLTVDVHDGAAYKSHHVYFGRFLTFLTIALVQSFIVTMGDMFILGTYVADKFWFVLFGLLISTVFVLIVYSLVSVFGNVGKSMAIILLVLQVAGSGGTFPIQMTPKFFQVIYPFLPFTYAISIIRETVGGILWDIVWKDLFILSMYIIIMFVMALVLKKPINKSSEKFMENAKGSKLIH
ncbi:YhgE/Pip domain-containing protein [Ectobacillus panaciterrae]|uniref:YhgE/Pip domain-containing protein n=1 Tax=Ectobacillus panaciterrae TaxID=363872 RepID=UPI0004174E99|nr:YhgE/Pip domain-containing protein [Ectobacillus panaciterrae]